MLFNDIRTQIQEQIKEKIYVGSIFYASDFKFEDNGETRDKYCIILSTDSNEYYYILFCLTTSKVEKYSKIMEEEDFVLIPAGIECFYLDTMIRITKQNIRKLSKDEFINLTPNWKGTLPQKYLIELIKKIKDSDKIPHFFKTIINN